MMSTLSFVETWQTWYAQPVSFASFTSRAIGPHSLSEQMPR